MLTIEELDHVVLNVADVERSLAFYVDGLGLEGERVDAFRRGEVKFPSVRVTSGTIIDLFPPRMHGTTDRAPGNLNHICLVTANTPDEIRTHLEAIGASIEQGPVEGFGARGVGLSYYTRDPDGNGIELRTYG
jgi:catechol 2,3-dioxygenase-like lactoylglutathione lyase family enzyme